MAEFQPIQGKLSVKVTSLTKSYGSTMALKSMNLNLYKKSCLGFVGPNGAGKTTFFKSLLGLLKLQDGNITILGENVIENGKILSSMKKIRSKVGYVPDFPKMYPFLTVEEFFTFLGKLFGLNIEQLKTRIEYLINFFELHSYRKSIIKTLSRGNYQKVSLSSALIHQPELLLLDEPFSSLDVFVRRKTKELIENFVKDGIPELGIMNSGSVIISSHILSDIEDLCNHVSVISSGEIAWNGLISEINMEMSQNNSLEELVLGLWNNDDD